MTSELMSLTWVTALTAIIWMPYILNLIAVRGLMDAVGYPEEPKPLFPWAAKNEGGTRERGRKPCRVRGPGIDRKCCKRQ